MVGVFDQMRRDSAANLQVYLGSGVSIPRYRRRCQDSRAMPEIWKIDKQAPVASKEQLQSFVAL
jgi:hypothetical protein